MAERRYNRAAALTAVTSAPFSHHRSVTIVQPQLSSLTAVAERRYNRLAALTAVTSAPLSHRLRSVTIVQPPSFSHSYLR
ncbi:MAG: hypothetical protein K0B15_04675 [Lentimicrobium sp.]|nr:hypothetical protein [Lentimicrobium sp.]